MFKIFDCRRSTKDLTSMRDNLSKSQRKLTGLTRLSHVNDTELISSEASRCHNKKDCMIAVIRKSVIGARCTFITPFGKREVVYADSTTSGIFLRSIEEYMANIIGAMYANTYTGAFMTGAQTTTLREEAREIIRHAVNAPKNDFAVLFTGNGATGAFEKLFSVIGFGVPEYADKKWKLSETLIPQQERPVVFISHLEHHSHEFISIWRESIVRCVVIDEDNNGLPDLTHLERELLRFKAQEVPMIGCFSAGCNITGIRAPTNSITKLLHQHGALAFFDYAGIGAYVNVDIQGDDAGNDDTVMDAIFMSPHKFIGGPGAAGVLVARHELFKGAFGVEITNPSMPRGGTVSFTPESSRECANDVEAIEDAGTPGIPQCIRAGLAFKVKEMVGSDFIESLEANHGIVALKAWQRHPAIALVGSDRGAYFATTDRVSIISFNVLSPVCLASVGLASSESHLSVLRTIRQDIPMAWTSIAMDRTDKNQQNPTEQKQQPVDSQAEVLSSSHAMLPLHHNFVIALLNDLYGIQGIGGCSCAGPYSYRLLGLGGDKGRSLSTRRVHKLAAMGYESFKPGWARINLNYFTSDHEVDFIVEAVQQIAVNGWKLLPYYIQDVHSGQFVHRTNRVKFPFSVSDFDLVNTRKQNNKSRQPPRVTYIVPKWKFGERTKSSYAKVLKKATAVYDNATKDLPLLQESNIADFTSRFPEYGVDGSDVWWLRPSEALSELVRLENS